MLTGRLVQSADAKRQWPRLSTAAWLVRRVGEVRDGGPMGRWARWGVGGRTSGVKSRHTVPPVAAHRYV